ncbi:MAG: hypothetical protein ACI8QC_000500, partial [Planctomycetota bacterium]
MLATTISSLNTTLGLAISLAFASPAAAQSTSIPAAGSRTPFASESIVLLQNAGGGQGHLSLHDAVSGVVLRAPARLARMELLEIDMVGRTALDRWDPTRVRHLDDVPGGRLSLPDGRGCLYRYKRLNNAGRTHFGFLLLEAHGGLRLLLDRQGTGLTTQTDPFLPFLAFDSNAESFVAATRPEAGGDLLIVNLANGQYASPTEALAPLEFGIAGHGLADNWGYAVSTTGILRFNRGPLAQAEFVTVAGGAPAWFSGQAAWSPQRSRVVTTAGSSSSALIAYVFGPSGEAFPASSTPAALAGAGYLPQMLGGPTLAVDDAGECAAWVESGITRELFIGRADSPTPAPGMHISSDAKFSDTFGETGLIKVNGPGSFTFALGEREDPILGGLEGADFYRATVGTMGSLTLENITGTSGDLQEPFFGSPSITPQEQLVVPGVGLLIYDDSGLLIAVRDAGSAVQILLQDVKDHDFFLPVDGGILVGLRRDLNGNPHEVRFIPDDLQSPTVLVDPSSPGNARLGAVRLNGTRIAYLLEANDVPSFVGVLDYVSGQAIIAATGISTLAPTLAAAPLGGVLFVRGVAPNPQLPVS